MPTLAKKTAGILLALALLFASVVTVAAAIPTKAEIDSAQIVKELTPIRDKEFGEKKGDLIILADKKTVCQNYELGYVYAELISDSKVQNKRDVGGMNISADGKRTFLSTQMESWIKGRPADASVPSLWNTLAAKFGSDKTFDRERVLGKIYEKYAALCDQGYNCGLPTDNLSEWDKSVIKLDFYDGDSEYGFETPRIHVTTIAYSFLNDSAYAIHDDIFNFYRESKAGSLSEPITDQFEYTLDGVHGQIQAFALGYIFKPDSGKLIVRAGVRWNADMEMFEILELDFDELTKTEITDATLDQNPYYGGRGLTMYEVQTLFYDKYAEVISKGFNPGIPDHEGIFYWDTELIKQAYVGSDGTGNAWGRTNMMLILNPQDKKVYMVQGEILNVAASASYGLGTAQLLGYPISDEKTMEINGFTYHYQDFYNAYYQEYGTIYSINNQSQLARYVRGKTFAQTVTEINQKPNNPLYFYVMEPWLIAVICAGGALVLGGAGFAVYFFVFRKKKTAKVAEVKANEEEE